MSHLTAATARASTNTRPAPASLTPTSLTRTSLIDEVMGGLAHGETALFDDLAQAAWSPQATLGQLTGSLAAPRTISEDERAA